MEKLKDKYTVELWFWNGLSNDLRSVTGVLFARGNDRLTIGGSGGNAGHLTFCSLVGRRAMCPKTWNYVALVRDGAHVKVYLNGHSEPDLEGMVPVDDTHEIRIGGGANHPETFEGKIDEVALYGYALTSEEVRRHVLLAREALAPDG